MPFFKNVFKSKDGSRSASKAAKYGDHAEPVAQLEPPWEESWSRKEVAPERIQELIHVCTQEMKSRGAYRGIESAGVPLLTRNSPGHALRTASLPPRGRYKCLAQLCAQLLQVGV
jgi:hypothetical protein